MGRENVTALIAVIKSKHALHLVWYKYHEWHPKELLQGSEFSCVSLLNSIHWHLIFNNYLIGYSFIEISEATHLNLIINSVTFLIAIIYSNKENNVTLA